MSRLSSAIAICGLSAVSSLALASTYQYELRANYDHYESNSKSPNAHDDIYNLTGTVYLAPVNTNNYPLAQAGFLSRTNNISLHYSYNDGHWSDSNPDYSDAPFEDSYREHELTAIARFYWFDGLLYTSVGATESRYEYKSKEFYPNNQIEYSEGKSHSHWRGQASIGISPFAGLLVYTNIYEGVNYDDYVNLNVQYVKTFGQQAIATHIRIKDYYDVLEVLVDVDYHFTPRLSVGISLTDNEHYVSNYEWKFNTRYFVTQNISVEGVMTKYNNGDALLIGGTIRF